MQCPACGRSMTARMVGEIEVDVCEGGCGGIWFDQFELQKLDDGDEADGQQLLDVTRDPTLTVDLEQRRACPRCDDVVLMRHAYGAKREVIVDSCAGCAGYFLDAGELAVIRRQYETESDREQDIKSDFQSAIGQQMESLALREQSRAKDLKRMFRFFRISYYVGGE